MTEMRRQRTALPVLRMLAMALALAALPGLARDPARTAPAAVPASGVIGVEDAYFSPGFWIARTQAANRALMAPAAIDARNARLLRDDDSMHDLSALPASLTRAQVAGWIEGLASPPAKPLWDEAGKPVPKASLDAIVGNRAMEAIPANQATRYGMAVQRAALRAFPTALRVFSSDDDADIDRFQESALFPGDPVAIAHASADGQWLFVVSPRYAAWVEAKAIASGDRATVLAYAQRMPYRVITGAKPRTVFTREEPRVSEVQLDMGVRIPQAGAPLDEPVNGQHPYSAWILDLPVRNADGGLGFAPALLQKNADSAPGYLPLTRANIIRQAFKFLGERYGWGHDYGTRDCSGFVSEVYRSFGVVLPRNTSDQATSPALDRVAFVDGDVEARRKAVKALDTGDLVYIPGHVMMVIGKDRGLHYVIHDTTGFNSRGADGAIERVKLNGVSVTPLETLLAGDGVPYVDRITAIQRIRRTGEARK